MPINSFLYPAKHVPVVYEVANSLRFNDGSSDYLNKTLGTASNRKIFTISYWIKKTTTGIHIPIVEVASSGGSIGGSENAAQIYFNTSDQLTWYETHGGGVINLSTNRVFRDPNAWYHIMYAIDTTQGTSTNRLKLYINGVQETSFTSGSGTYPSQNLESYINSDQDATYIGRTRYNNKYFDGYMCEVVHVDGTAHSPTDLGEFDEDSPRIWKPKDVSGLTFGTNGFYLDFEDSSSLGNDAAGSNNFTVNNLTAIDQSTDTCTNNFMTLNPLSTDSGVTLSEGNTESDFDGSVGNAKGNIGLTRGRWYWEVKLTNSTSGYPMIGIGSMNEEQMQKPTGGSYPGGFSNSYGVYGTNLRLYANGTNEGDQGSSYTTGDIFGIYLDLESSTKTIKWYKNGSSVLSDDITNAGDDYPYTCIDYNGGESSINVNYNFGNPAYSISSGNTDDNGYGNFEYSPNISSTKYYAVCSKNLAEFG
tara:strand:- start:1044 stop:2468 length:1425 start_codon:yes stop_codon:yes gene_type:complete